MRLLERRAQDDIDENVRRQLQRRPAGKPGKGKPTVRRQHHPASYVIPEAPPDPPVLHHPQPQQHAYSHLPERGAHSPGRHAGEYPARPDSRRSIPHPYNVRVADKPVFLRRTTIRPNHLSFAAAPPYRGRARSFSPQK